MKKALISTTESPVNYISGWTQDNPPVPIYAPIDNSCRVAQVVDIGNEFEVYKTLIWVDCNDNVIADQFYYNNIDGNIYPIPISE
jgi:hypothetical protein